jgi:hypothetical protein
MPEKYILFSTITIPLEPKPRLALKEKEVHTVSQGFQKSVNKELSIT